MPPRRRRQYGTGSIYQRASDGRWFFAVQAGFKANGARRVITKSAATEPAVKKKGDALMRQIAREGIPDAAASDRVTVKQWADVWLAKVARELKPNAYSATRTAVTHWIVPTIGHKRLVDLTPADVRAVANAYRRAGKKTSTALRGHATLIPMLKAAMLEGHTVPPRVLLVERPSANITDRQAMDLADAVAVLEVATRLLPHSSRWAAALLQGLRQGEALGLTWERDLGTALDISWQLQALPYVDRADKAQGFRVPDGFEARQLEGRLHLTRPKTLKGRRIVPIVPWMREALDAWRAIAPPSPHGLVWPAVDGSPADAKLDLEEWYALQATAGVAHPARRFYVGHEARHTTASLLLEAKVDPEVIKAILGHSSVVSTQAYLHVSDELTASAAARVAELLQLSPRT